MRAALYLVELGQLTSAFLDRALPVNPLRARGPLHSPLVSDAQQRQYVSGRPLPGAMTTALLAAKNCHFVPPHTRFVVFNTHAKGTVRHVRLNYSLGQKCLQLGCLR